MKWMRFSGLLFICLISQMELSSQLKTISILGGLNFSGIIPIDDLNNTRIFNRRAAHFGLRYSVPLKETIPFGDDFYLTVTCSYDQKGFNQQYFVTDTVGAERILTEGINYEFDYYSPNVTFAYLSDERLSFRLALGLYGAFLLKGSKTTPSLTNGQPPLVENLKGKVTANDYGLIFETGWSYQLSEEVDFGMLANYQLSNVPFKNSEFLSGARTRQRTLVTSLFLSYRLGSKKATQ